MSCNLNSSAITGNKITGHLHVFFTRSHITHITNVYIYIRYNVLKLKMWMVYVSGKSHGACWNFLLKIALKFNLNFHEYLQLFYMSLFWFLYPVAQKSLRTAAHLFINMHRECVNFLLPLVFMKIGDRIMSDPPNTHTPSCLTCDRLRAVSEHANFTSIHESQEAANVFQ